MKTPFRTKPATLAAACALAFAFAGGPAQAQSSLTADERDVWTAGSQPWKNAAGECWQTGSSSAAPGAACSAAAPAKYVAPVPVSEAPAPEAAPIVLAKAAPPAVERLALDANVLFDFDKSELRQAGRDSLDAFVADAGALTDASPMVAVGYADRLGSDGYNQALSEARVAAVKSYLVAKGVGAGRVDASARGETQPSTRGECDGPVSAKTIACLQPDRRVFIELSGSRPAQ